MQRLLPSLAIVAIVFAAQPNAPSPKAAPIRALPWAQLNFLHTTDTHGWYGGHLQEPSYSADWGDYVSFVQHLRKRADDDGVDLLLIDNGDRIEGNGLYDASDPKGKYIFDIFKQQQFDIVTTGNHELYKAHSSNDEYCINVPNFEGDYISSNVDVYDFKTNEFVPLARRFKKFKTKNQGIRILAFGFLYDFQGQGNSNYSRIQPVEDTIKEQWFLDAIHDKDYDLILVTGHISLRMEEYQILFETIRKLQWDTPIAMFGGHFHVRDFRKFDDKAAGIASGRYLETFGFMSMEGLNTANNHASLASPTYDRLYIDNNLYSLHYHSQKNDTTFPTADGRNVSQMITEARKKLHLDQRYGCAPKNLWVNRVKYDDKDSIFYWLQKQVLPDSLAENRKDSTPKFLISNTGAMRFDLFKGPVTVDTTFLISPFTGGFSVLKDVKYNIAIKILDVLNSQTKVLALSDPDFDTSLLAPIQRVGRRPTSMSQSFKSFHQDFQQSTLNHSPDLLPGYTTIDDMGDDGDDTLHSFIQFYDVPNCIQSAVDFPEDPNTPVPSVDIVYNDFVEPFLIRALEFLGSTRYVNETMPYNDGKPFTSIIFDWIRENWPCNEKSDL